MSIDRDDPRLTAYALGEMRASERAAFQRELEQDPQARELTRLLDEIQLVVEQVDEGWKRDLDMELTNEQRAAVFLPRPRWWPLVAALVILAISTWLYANSRAAVNREQQTASEFREYKTLMEAEREAFMSSERTSFLEELKAQRKAALQIDEQAIIKIGNEELHFQLAQAEQAAGKYRTTIQEQGNRITTLQEINRTLKLTGDKQQSFKKRWQDEVRLRVDAEERLKQSREEFDALVRENEEIEKKWRDAEFWLGKYRDRYQADVSGGITGGPAGADGVVKNIKGRQVLISVGSNDKVRRGDTYQLRRGADYVGQIVIITVFRNASIGVFDVELKGSGAPPRPDDVAEARGY